jgi:hypothetical protein
MVNFRLSQTLASTAALQPPGAQNCDASHLVPHAPHARGSRVVSAQRVALQHVKSVGHVVLLQGARH